MDHNLGVILNQSCYIVLCGILSGVFRPRRVRVGRPAVQRQEGRASGGPIQHEGTQVDDMFLPRRDELRRRRVLYAARARVQSSLQQSLSGHQPQVGDVVEPNTEQDGVSM